MTQFARRWSPYLYVLPVVVISGGLIYLCIGFTAYASLTDWNGLFRMNLVGLQNFRELFTDRVFWVALGNTLLFMVVTVGVQAGIGLVAAVLLAQRLYGATLVKAILFLPIAMAPAIIATVFKYLLEANFGTLNETLRAVGLLGPRDVIEWLGPDLGIWSIITINVFQWTGFSMMVYLAGVLAIPAELHEAAIVDGAGWWRRLWSVILPSLRGTTNVLVVLGIVGSLKTFDIVYLTTGGGPADASQFLTTLLYQQRASREAGLASATGLVILVVAFVLSAAQIALSRRQR